MIPRENKEADGSAREASAGRVLLFAGHMIDREGRHPPRFPAAMEPLAAEAIAGAVARERARFAGTILGIAGGACGGDILFHEACRARSIPSRLYLAVPPDEYVQRSVAHAGPHWVERFNRLVAEGELRVLAASKARPARQHGSIWQRSNQWMLSDALAHRGRLVLIALWNRKEGDGAGGTSDMIHQARAHGARIIILDTNVLFARA